MVLIPACLDDNFFAQCPEKGLRCLTQVFQPQRKVNHCLTSLTGPTSAGDLGHEWSCADGLQNSQVATACVASPAGREGWRACSPWREPPSPQPAGMLT